MKGIILIIIVLFRCDRYTWANKTYEI